MFEAREAWQMTKESQRAEVHKTIWRIANDQRGSVDGWDFKTYVLGLLFYRFISENLTAYINEGERKAGDASFSDYTKLKDHEAEIARRETVEEKGFYILPSELFVNVRAMARKDENLNEALARVFKNIEGSDVGTGSEDDLKGLLAHSSISTGKIGDSIVSARRSNHANPRGWRRFSKLQPRPFTATQKANLVQRDWPPFGLLRPPRWSYGQDAVDR